jgi:hypothetical protein
MGSLVYVMSLEIPNYSDGVSGMGVKHRRVYNVQECERFMDINCDLYHIRSGLCNES